MKIHKQGKKSTLLHPGLAEVINKIVDLPQDELPDYLGSYQTWMWPRSDLHSWVRVLNKFDEILKGFIEEYELDKLQLNPFTPLTKSVILAILRFETLLLDNSTNRKLFASYDRINSLLFSEDTDVIIGALQLLLKPSQQYSSQPSASQTLHVSNKRLTSLASRWPGVRENGLEFLDLFDASKTKADIPPEAAQVTLTFYRKGDSTAVPQAEKPEPASPTRPRASSAAGPSTSSVVTNVPAPATTVQGPGMVTIHIPSLIDTEKRPVDILADEIEKHSIPDEEKFELLARIRCAAALGKGPAQQKERENLAVIRLLAIAIFAHTVNESEAQNSLFLYEPELVAHIAELIHPDRVIAMSIQTAALAALDGLCRYRTKTGEVLAAVNAGVTHGILMSLMRRTVAGLADPESSITTDFAESLFSFVAFLSSSPAGGAMIAGAGVIPLLVQLIHNTEPRRLQVISKITTLIDVSLYGYGNAFQSFCTHRGVDALLQRIEHEVNLDIEESKVEDPLMYTAYGELPFTRSLLLKHVMRTMQRMMQASGTSEGLRGLIDGSLPKSIKKIIQNRGLFGPAIFAIAINIMASFVHNEPTSLTILQEAGLPSAFYDAIEKGLESANEVVAAVPSAIGALCLNQAGLDQLNQRSTIIPKLFSILTSDRHVKTLQDKDNATYLGAAMDELIRHHPSLKDVVFSAIQGMLERIVVLGNEYIIPQSEAASYGLRPLTEEHDTEMVPAQPATASSSTPGVAESSAAATAKKSEETDPSALSEDGAASQPIITYIDIACRFLEGLFQHTTHCREFVNKNGVDLLIKLYDIPTLPSNFHSTPAAQSIISVVRAIAEAIPNPTLERLMKMTKEKLDETRHIWKSSGDEKRRPTACLEISADSDIAAINEKYRQLLTLHLRVNLLASVYSTAGYTHGRPANGIITIIGTGTGPATLEDLAEMYRVFLWEGIVLKGADPAKQLTIDGTHVSLGSATPVIDAPNDAATPATDAAPSAKAAGTVAAGGDTKASPSVQEENAKAIRSTVQNLAKVTTPLFQAIVKLFLYSRRNPEPSGRQQANQVAKHVTQILIKHLDWRGSDDKVVGFTYSTLVIGLLAVLLFDERTTQNTLHTLLLVTIKSMGGLDRILAICKSYTETLAAANPDPAARSVQEASEFNVATAGLGVALHLLLALSSAKPLLESGQTSMLVTREKSKTDPAYFEPHDFLIKMRSAIFPFLQSLWNADWLGNASQDIAKLVVQIFLEIMSAEGEDTTASSANTFADLLGSANPFAGGAARRAPPAGPDENRIQQLVDMGFPRANAEVALTRTHNNLSAATEYLLLHPFPLVAPGAASNAAPAPDAIAEDAEVPGEGEDAGAAENTSRVTAAIAAIIGAASDDVDMDGEEDEDEDDDTDRAEGVDGPAQVTPSTEEPAVADRDWAEELKQARATAVPGIASRALWILGKFPELVFDVKRAFTGSKYQAEVVRTLISDAKSFMDPTNVVPDVALASRLRLLALVLSELPPSSSLAEEDANSLATSFSRKLPSTPHNAPSQEQTSTPWLAPLLLTLETLFILGEDIGTATLPKADEPVPTISPKPRYALTEARQTTFDFCFSFLSHPTPTRNELIACLRLLVLLTRNHRAASEFLTRGGLPVLLDRFKGTGADGRGCQVHVILILRHIIEDRSVLESLMKRDMIVWFSQPRTRVADISTFLRHNSQVALRDYTTFIDSCKTVCMLTSGSPASGSGYAITLKKDVSASSQAGAVAFDPLVVSLNQTSGAEPEAGPEEPPASHTIESLDLLLRYLLSEVTRVGKNAVQASLLLDNPDNVPSNRPTLSPGAIEASSAVGAHEGSGEGQTVDYVYTCFLLQCLTELFSAYTSCKLAFNNHSRKRLATPSKELPKPRANLLHFILSEMISAGDTSATGPAANKKRMTLNVWAMSVVVSLCLDPTVSSNLKDVPPEVVASRRLVVDAIAKAIRESLPGETLESRYSRLGALAELTFRLLNRTSAPGPGAPKPQGDAHLHIAKVMLEKNFVLLLTTTLGEVDLNFPNVRSLVTTLVRPLELLTKLAIKMGRATDKKHPLIVSDEEDSESEMSLDEEEEEQSGDDETPDLYRNSALGMYGGDMEEVAYPAHEDGLDGMEEEEEDGEMEYGDEEMGSDHTSETSQDEDDDDEGDIDVISEGSHSQHWDADAPSEDDEEGDGEGDSVEGDDIEEGMDQDEALWEDDPEGINDPLGDVIGRLEDEVELQQQDEEGDDEDNDVHQLALRDLGNLDVQLDGSGDLAEGWEVHDVGAAENGQTGLDGVFHPSAHPRRGRLVDMDEYLQMFGRSRPADTGAADPSTHPLMAISAQGPPAAATTPHHHSRTAQRRSLLRGSGAITHDPNSVPSGLVSMIRDLIGEDGMQIVEQMVVRGAAPAETILELRTSGGGPPISVAQLVHSRHVQRPAPTAPTDAPHDPLRFISEFTPVSTPQRWIDEGKMTQGRNAGDRIAALVNFVILALLPDARARDAEEQVKRQAQAEAAAKAEADAEAEAAAAAAVAAAEAEAKAAAEASTGVPHSTEIPEIPMAPAETIGSNVEGSVDIVTSASLPPGTTGDEDVDMADPSDGLTSAVVPTGPIPAVAGEAESTTVPPSSPPPTEEQSADAGTSAHPASRVTISVHGEIIDITDTGIDPTFLEALPDDMRQEVINQHMRERRAAEPVARPEESQIAPEFLDALPPEIRAELLQQEQDALDRARRERERAEAPPGAVPQGGPSDIDSASFLASLDPALRHAVLMDQDDGFLQTLPSALLAEASAALSQGIRPPRASRPTNSLEQRLPSPTRKPTTAHESIQLLDKAGVATLVRMLFFPQVLRKSAMHKVLANLCENSKTRTDLFNLLLGVLRDGAVDVGAVDQSFSQLSFRPGRTHPASSKTPTKARADSYHSIAESSNSSPNLVTQRCLDALAYVVNVNEAAAFYFLSEQDALPGAKKPSSRKGKGKEKPAPSTHFPIVLLLNLLDREPMLKSPAMIGMVAQLLATVTKPLAGLKEASEVQPAQPPTTSSTTEPAASVPVPENVSAPTPTNAAGTGVDPANTAEVIDQGTRKPLDALSKLRTAPPHMPPASLLPIANILTSGECTAKTFQSTMSLIQNISNLPDAKETVTQELKARAEVLGEALYRDLQELTKVLAETPEGVEVSPSMLTKFSSASADQAKLLRLLKMLDFMYLPRSTTAQAEGEAPRELPEDNAEEIRRIYSTFHFDPLWRQLSDALAVIEAKPALDHVATVLLPIMETLMVVSKHVGFKQPQTPAPAPLLTPTSPRSPVLGLASHISRSDDLFATFTDTHRKILNVMVRNNPSLMSGSFALLVNNPKVLDFDNKRNYFGQQLRRRPHSRENHVTLQLNVRRAHVFEDSYQYLHRKTGEQIKHGKLSIRFYEEEGVDAGGVTREWFQILARQMFNPDYALFQPCAGDKLTYQPNRFSAINPEHLSFFKFVGRVIGKAIYDGRLLDAYFARSLYRQILGKAVDYKDVEWVDPEYFNSLVWILENDPSVLDMNFTVEADEFGLRRTVELKEGGAQIPVTQENKREFVQLSAQYRLVSSIKEQIDALLGGFYEIIPKDLIAIFNEQEVELLISGTPDIDIDEWRAATEYHGYSQTDPVIAWWWRALKSFNRDERAKVLSFATGTSRVPLGGFGDLQGVQGVQKFSIHRAYGEPDRLPQAHTCFNQIDLPQFSSYEMLRQQLLLAINEGGEGFGFA